MILLLACIPWLSPESVAAGEEVGVFRWQFAPFCNVVTLAVELSGTGATLTGADDNCGGGQSAAFGTAAANPNGTFALGLTIVTQGGAGEHVDVVLNASTISGTWQDASGNSGTFQFNPPGPASGVPRPAPAINGTSLVIGSVGPEALATGAVTTPKLAPGAVDGSKLAPGAVGAAAINPTQVQQRVTGTCAAGQAVQGVNQDGTVACGTASGGNWALGGNAGTTPGTHFLGTTDNKALEVKVNNQRAWRVEPASATFPAFSGSSPNVLGGRPENTVTAGVGGATVAGGGSATGCSGPCSNRVTDDFGTVAGGVNNQAGDGAGTTIDACCATVAGGIGNTASGVTATVAGGQTNLASGPNATVAGGIVNTASGASATVGGGQNNAATGFAATVGGGQNHVAIGVSVTVGGGASHTASGVGATVAGGQANAATGLNATVAGGTANAAIGGAATVGGGQNNVATGVAATVAGGSNNIAAGDVSFAAGQQAFIDAMHPGTFLWADTSNFSFTSVVANEFAVRSTGGARIVTAIDALGAPTAGVEAATGASAWSALSDRDSKEHFAPVDGRSLLERLAGIPIQTWNWKSQDPGIRHIGPVAQDFHAAFCVGEDPRQISTVDADGVALAAIQALYWMTQTLEAKVREIDQLRQRLEVLEAGRAVAGMPR